MKKAGTAVVILNDQYEVLILLRTKEARWAPLRWGYPGGKVEPGETPQAAAVRETKEETELEVDKLTPFEANIGGLENFENQAVWSYHTRYFRGNVKIDYEHDDWQWVARADIEKYNLAPGVLEMFDWVLNNE